MKQAASQESQSFYRYQVQPIEGFPDLLKFHQLNPERYPFLMESVLQGDQEGRYDLLLAFPQKRLIPDHSHSFFSHLQSQWSGERALSEVDQTENIPPFRGGWFVFLSYELAGEIEPRLSLSKFDDRFPRALLVRCPAAIVRDHQSRSCYFVCESSYAHHIEELRQDVTCMESVTETEQNIHVELEEEEETRFLNSVEKIKNYIRDGDVFQVNLSRLWRGKLNKDVSAASLYRQLRRTNPSPFAGLARLDRNCWVISSSPERLIKTEGQKVVTRPIAGTYPRGGSATEDEKLAKELTLHPKERAEHIMLIDLERNDLGRVCEPGSVNVSDFMVVESYEHVHHIVSQVEGRLKSGTSPAEIIRAVFPGGTITGCPKVRCMEIISELESSPRGAYTGAMGYLNRDGDMDLNILIRSMAQHKDQIYFRAGSGIVADSIPDRELAETRNKAKGLLRAFGL